MKSIAHLASHFLVLRSVCECCRDQGFREGKVEKDTNCMWTYRSWQKNTAINISSSQCMVYEKVIEHLDQYKRNIYIYIYVYE